MLSGYLRVNAISLPTYSGAQSDLNYMIEVTFVSGMNADFSDINFTDEDGETELYQYRETYTASTTATWWIKVPTSPAAGKTIYMYSGKPSATLRSSGDNTFLFFDDFTVDLSKWTEPGGAGVFTLVGSYLQAQARAATDTFVPTTTISDNEYVGVRAKLRHNYPSSGSYRTGFTPDAVGKISVVIGAGTSFSYSTGQQAGTHFGDDTFGVVDMIIYATNNVQYYRNGVLDWTDEVYTAAGANSLQLISYAISIDGGYCQWDYIFAYQVANDETEFAALTLGDATILSTGRKYKFAYENSVTTWGTAVAPGANDAILLTDLGPIVENTEMIKDWCSGFAWNQYIYKGKKIVEPEIKMPLRYSGREWSFVAQLLGVDAVTGAGPYTHTIDVLDAIDGGDLFGTLVALLGYDTTQILIEWPSLKPKNFKIEVDGNGYMSLSVNGVANKINQGSDATSVAADFDSVTHISLDSALPKIIPFGSTRFRINDFGDAALDTADIYKISKFTFEFERDLTQEFDSNESSDGWESSEPIENTIALQKITLDIPSIELTRLQEFQTQSTQKADVLWDFDGTYSVLIEFPCVVQYSPDVSVQGQSRIMPVLTYTPIKPSSAPTGMTRTNIGITIIDDYSGVYS